MLALVAACADGPAADGLDDMTEPLPPPDVRGKYLDVYPSDGSHRLDTHFGLMPAPPPASCATTCSPGSFTLAHTFNPPDDAGGSSK